MHISKIAHLPTEEVLLDINITLAEEVNLIFKEVHHISAMTEEANHQSSKTKESSIEIQLFNQTIQTLSKAIQHNIKSLDKLKVLELLRDHKFMDQIFKNSLILKEFQLELIQDLDQLLLLVRFKSPYNMNMQDSLSFQLIKAYWKSKIL